MDNRKISPNPMKNEVVPPVYLKNLDSYKYSCTDYSIVGALIGQRYWNFVAQFVPRTVAPNAVTLAGFIINVTGVFGVLYYYFIAQEEVPSVAWYWAGIAVFLYSTLDAVDGKHARRTGTGSPMGELFDHGCDAVTLPILQPVTCIAVGVAPAYSFVWCITCCTALFLAHWETYCTGTLELGYLNAPTEGELLTVLIFFITGYKGQAFIAGPFAADFGASIPYWSYMKDIGIAPNSIGECLALLGTLVAIVTCIVNILHVGFRKTLRPKAECFLASVPIILIAFGQLCLLVLYPDIVHTIPFVTEMAFGFVASYAAGRLTIARLCRSPYHPWGKVLVISTVTTAILITSAVLPMYIPAAAFVAVLARKAAPPLLCVLLALFVWIYSLMLLSVFRQISEHLGINILTMTEKQRQKALKMEKEEKQPKRSK